MHVRIAAVSNQHGREPDFQTMKNMKISEIRKEVESLHSKLKSTGIHQYTIDLVENVTEELLEQETGESSVDDATLIGSLAYRIETLIEVARAETEDYLIYRQLQTIIEEGRK